MITTNLLPVYSTYGQSTHTRDSFQTQAPPTTSKHLGAVITSESGSSAGALHPSSMMKIYDDR